MGVVLHPRYSFPVHSQLRCHEARWECLGPSRLTAFLQAPMVGPPRARLDRPLSHCVWLRVRFPTATGEPFSYVKTSSLIPDSIGYQLR
jgi:hypothetical protein